MDIQKLLWDSTSSSDEDSEEERKKTVEIQMKSSVHPHAQVKTPCRTSILRGPIWVDELLQGHPDRIYDNLGMTKTAFKALCNLLVSRGQWVNKQQQRVDVKESLAIFLNCVTAPCKQVILAERFQHSTETCDRHVKQMARMLVNLAPEIIRPHNEDQVHPIILHNPNRFPFFKDCIGAIDGTAIKAAASRNRKEAYRDRKLSISQNVLAAVDHDMRFVFVHAGWEGSAHDSRVFMDAVLRRELGFPWPHNPGKYYLVDSGYPNHPGFMAPYKGERYHRSQWAGEYNFRGPRELFNHRHSSIRNVVERTFAALKKRFPLFKDGMPPYKPTRQIDLVIACCVIHNFVREQGHYDQHFHEASTESTEHGCGELEVNIGGGSSSETYHHFPNRSEIQAWLAKRDAIASQLWTDFIN